MNPPFGEGSEHTSQYMNDNYPAWSKNLVCAFFDRMQEMLDDEGKLGAILISPFVAVSLMRVSERIFSADKFLPVLIPIEEFLTQM